MRNQRNVINTNNILNQLSNQQRNEILQQLLHSNAYNNNCTTNGMMGPYFNYAPQQNNAYTTNIDDVEEDYDINNMHNKNRNIPQQRPTLMVAPSYINKNNIKRVIPTGSPIKIITPKKEKKVKQQQNTMNENNDYWNLVWREILVEKGKIHLVLDYNKRDECKIDNCCFCTGKKENFHFHFNCIKCQFSIKHLGPSSPSKHYKNNGNHKDGYDALKFSVYIKCNDVNVSTYK